MKSHVFTVITTLLLVLNLTSVGFSKADEANETKLLDLQKAKSNYVITETPILPTPEQGIMVHLKSLQAGCFNPTSVFIIPAGAIDENKLGTLKEDMFIMLRILDKKLKQSNVLTSSDYAGSFWGGAFWGNQPIQGIYLEDYGALFLLRVNFPLSPPVEMKDEETKEDVDEVWKETKKELYTIKDTSFGIKDYYSPYKPSPETKYDADKVKNLERELIKALKHATNIRDLEPDESIIITVSEDKAQDSGLVSQRLLTIVDKDKLLKYKEPIATQMPASKVLTVRIKKSDIDAFSEGKLNYEQFRQRASVFTY